MTSSQKRQRRQNRYERGNAIKNLVTGFLGGLILGALPVLLILITLEGVA